MDVRDRLRLLQELEVYLKQSLGRKDGSSECIDANTRTLLKKLKVLDRIGSASLYGEAYKLCFPVSCNDGECECEADSHFFALKKIPIPHEHWSFLRSPNDASSPQALKTALWGEIMFLRLCRVLVDNKVTPNLPLYGGYYICGDCQFQNPELDETNGPCVLLINEYANAGDLKHWSRKVRSTEEWFNAFFQIFAALYALQKYFDATHHDLHPGNVLVHKIKPGGYWRYTIDGNIYDVPNQGWLFTLWDFGFARIPNKIETQSDWPELYESHDQLPRYLTDYRRISNAPIWAQAPQPDNIRHFVEHIHILFTQGAPVQSILTGFLDKYATSNNHVILEEYSFDKRLQMDPSLHKFIRHETWQAVFKRPTRSQVKAQDQLKDVLQFDNRFREQVQNALDKFADDSDSDDDDSDDDFDDAMLNLDESW